MLRLPWKKPIRSTVTNWLSLHSAMVLCLLLVSHIEAEPIRIENSGFELPVLGDGGYNNNAIPGWVLNANAEFQMGVWNPDADLAEGALSEGAAFEGQNVAYHNSGIMSQTLSETLAPNMTYTLTVQQNLSRVGSTKGIWEVALLAGGSPLVSLSDTVASLERDKFVLRTLQHTTDSLVEPGQSLGIRLSLTGPGDVTDVVWDDVSLLLSEPLFAGDADQDLDFDQLDLVRVQIAAKYLTGRDATWGEGDWNGAPGGGQGVPPEGDGVFDSLDVVAALAGDKYLTGPYAAIAAGGTQGDGQTSLVYDATTGELGVDAPAGTDLTSINITSVSSSFVGDKPTALDGAFDNFAANNVFKATFGGSFGSITFGNVLPVGMSQDEVSADLSAVGSLSGGGDLGNVDLVYVPEPAACGLLAFGLLIDILRFRRTRV